MDRVDQPHVGTGRFLDDTSAVAAFHARYPAKTRALAFPSDVALEGPRALGGG
jgi:hypothetical protein